MVLRILLIAGLPNIPSDEHLDKKVDLTVDATAMGQSGAAAHVLLELGTKTEEVCAASQQDPSGLADHDHTTGLSEIDFCLPWSL